MTDNLTRNVRIVTIWGCHKTIFETRQTIVILQRRSFTVILGIKTYPRVYSTTTYSESNLFLFSVLEKKKFMLSLIDL